MKVVFQEVKLSQVINYFIEGYNIPELVHWETFIDHKKDVVIIKMLLEEKPKEICNG